MESRITSRSNVKKAYWQQQIRNWKTSGLSQKQFCRRQSLALSTFSYWPNDLIRAIVANLESGKNRGRDTLRN